ncbi:glycosylated lysosomal membrane protein B-like [Daktulosphaira vitifoliae]|uniref:glycosylated lysosomal membrane protein B-like n=1 Tax=Daktulosphaira vitifoliae TaxID=58002 RepID=UPI0021AA7E71|nr:glycosylated lysosomal membrane protein B-like [Daktulosphaira vitifoliae]XP_050548649.1 glycosylated lysosomal membrane protein B-like [Daktulosphaira vitifoliae]XP_050548650.1 glycosylated lysosomal membrane protein B-like [Daktulosphaira vitifoliae]
MQSLILIFAITISLGICERKLNVEYNPGCPLSYPENCSQLLKLAYVRADGANDTIHFIFGFTYKPSLIISKTNKNSEIKINYDELKSNTANTILFSEVPLYTFATVFNNLYEYVDVNDTARLENGSNFLTMDFRKFQNWTVNLMENDNNETVHVKISSNLYRDVGITKRGNVSITLKVYAKEDKGLMFPHLIHTPESSELTLTLDHLTLNNPKSRYAVELLTLSSYPYNATEKMTLKTFNDDSSSGGVFSSYLIDAKGEDLEGGGYLTWKPVVFKAYDTHAFNSSSTTQYSIEDHSNQTDWIKSTLFNLFGNQLFEQQFMMKALNISFGEPNDGFYSKSNYLYWTFLAGVGAPPNGGLGFFEVSIIASLLLLLTITMILVFCVFTRWISSKRQLIIYGQ